MHEGDRPGRVVEDTADRCPRRCRPTPFACQAALRLATILIRVRG
ncbi:hypothetical protein SMD11_0580 [Streptomyces albireticuli]|uniref:Uncharacterized protein n=1 Tax=Streptomyces albireticuli TaxID=1940 RepID=A0A1Z2KW47_9ACTN|nr:hypothetical protein SMD11_0580 [Streptomyces albireticuli]